jgi:hypothetical protein
LTLYQDISHSNDPWMEPSTWRWAVTWLMWTHCFKVNLISANNSGKKTNKWNVPLRKYEQNETPAKCIGTVCMFRYQKADIRRYINLKIYVQSSLFRMVFRKCNSHKNTDREVLKLLSWYFLSSLLLCTNPFLLTATDWLEHNLFPFVEFNIWWIR